MLPKTTWKPSTSPHMVVTLVSCVTKSALQEMLIHATRVDVPGRLELSCSKFVHSQEV